MKVKYNRLSSLSQTGNRLTDDKSQYDLVLLDRVSGSVGFKERPKGQELTKLVEQGKISELWVEEFSRLGRNTGDVIKTLEWLDEMKVNVVVRNIGLQSRPNGQKNPIWKMISSVMSSLYEMELENIKERTMVGRKVYVLNGGRLGRPEGTKETEKDFLEKPQTKEIIKNLKKGLTIKDICKIVDCSNKTIIKTKRIGIKHNLITIKNN
ncbi:recombinase family protein [Aquirufa nivalisilvae]|uniref:recombinase family protein n=1 Tax=Aquirufa nivalisilvae TaxID=2516557 RepID=UPI0022A930BD|nr:recombinase family protein [Aquirufa nivalisilvae]MCZ2481293.1 recombinase family protein [Aquirufa nivalisilvae]